MVQPNHKISRERVNESLMKPTDMPKSGFDLGYKSYNAYTLGKLAVSGYQHIMPADKFNGNNSGSFTFERMVTPNISDVNVCQHNFFVTFRSIDRTWEDAFAPNINNSMSSSWRAPSFTLSNLVDTIFNSLGVTAGLTLFLNTYDDGNKTLTAANALSAANTLFSTLQSTPAALNTSFTNGYCSDMLTQLKQRWSAYATQVQGTMTCSAFLQLYLDAVLTPFVGENSLLDAFGYNYLRRSDIIKLGTMYPDYAHLLTNIDVMPQNEYALRAYYAVWYEYYRDDNLEPVRNTLLNWKNFGSTAVVSSNLWMLLQRFRTWQRDLFVSSMPDDMSRHVFAPVYATAGNNVQQLSGNADYLSAENKDTARNISTYSLTYRDPVTNSSSTIVCPLPKQVNDALVSADASLSTYKLDLFQLRNAQMLERYLKRNFYFGDEYKDRMLAHYGSVVSDMRINRPQLLSTSVQPFNRSQEISPTTTPNMAAGARTITATANSSSDGFEFYAEEFGIVLNLISFMPLAQYAGLCPQNILSRVTDFPIPEFSGNTEEYGRYYEIATSGLSKITTNGTTFGHFPYAHAWRSRVNEVHGPYLSDKQDYTFRRFFGLDSTTTIPLLNSEFIHCKPNLDMFADGRNLPFETQVYGETTHHFYVERVLPTPVEMI